MTPHRDPELGVLLQLLLRGANTGPPDVQGCGVNWPRLLGLAERHRVVPLLMRALHNADIELPAAIAKQAATTVHRIATLNMARTQLLLQALGSLEKAGVSTIAYKGPLLSQRLYGDATLRQFSDLDVLIEPRQWTAARTALVREGFQLQQHFSPRQDALFARVDGDYSFVHEPTGALLELHLRVCSHRFVVGPDTGDLFSRSVSIKIGGKSVRTLSDEDILLVGCLHGAKHRWDRLAWVTDLVRLLVLRPDLDWSALHRRAAGLGAERVLALGLMLTGVASASHDPSAGRSDARIAALADEVRMRWSREHEQAGPDAPGNLLFNLRALSGWRDRVRYINRWLLIPTPEDWTSVSLPDALFPLYYGQRPIRLAGRLFARAVSRTGAE